jgi:hypothetical protein
VGAGSGRSSYGEGGGAGTTAGNLLRPRCGGSTRAGGRGAAASPTLRARSGRPVPGRSPPARGIHRLPLNTDGLLERRGEDIEAGLDRLREVVGAHRPEDGSEALCRRVVGDLAGGHLDDDVALLAVRLTP